MWYNFSRGEEKIPKVKRYYDEELEKFQDCINQLYLQVGGYEEIQKMCYWDFLSIIETLNINNKRSSGKTVTHNKIPQSSQDMINRAKGLKK